MVTKKIYTNLRVLIIFLAIIFSLNFISAAEFQFNGTVKSESGTAINNSVINITVRNAAGWAIVGYNSTTSNETGEFNFSMGDDSQTSWIYEISITHRNITALNETFILRNFVDYRSKIIPAFPAQMVQMLSGTTFYLTPAGTINITVVNSTGARIPFQYQIKDTKLGYSIASVMDSYTNESLVYVPTNRNYSIMVYPYQSMPISYNWDNFTCPVSYNFSYVSKYNVTTVTLHKTFNASMTMARVTGYINYSDISGWDNFTVIPLLLEPGNMVHSQYGAMPYNLSSMNQQTDFFNLTDGFFNISLPATAESSTIILFASAIKNGVYYGGFRNISLSYGADPTNGFNFTQMSGMLGSADNMSMDVMGQQGGNKIAIPVKKQTFNLVDSTNAALASVQAHVEVTVDYSSYGAMQFTWMVDVQQSQSVANFAIPLINATGIKEMNLFVSGGPSGGNSQYTPKRTSKTVSEIVASNNIPISTFNPGGINETLSSSSVSIALYASNSTCDIPNPGSGCLLQDSSTMASFNPMKAVMGGGKISFRMGTGNIFVHYVNVDLLASGPPDASFDSSSTKAVDTSTFAAAQRFGSQGPTIYDYVLVSIPYDDGPNGLKDNIPVRLSIPTFYDDNWNVIWDVRVNGTNAGALAGNYSHYSTYQSAWGNLTNSPTCTRTAITKAILINETNPCYIDTSLNRIWIRLPHFSGAGPSVNGSSATTRYTDSVTGIAYLNSTPVSGTYINRNHSIIINVTSNLTNFVNITLWIYNSSKVFNLTYNSTNPTIWVNLSDLSDGLWFFNASAFNDTAGFINTTDLRNITIDTVIPVLSFVTPSNRQNLSSVLIQVNLTVSDTNMDFTNITVYNSANLLITYANSTRSNYNVTLNVTSDGYYTINVSTFDKAGNVNRTSINITIDTTAPVIKVISFKNNSVYYANQTIVVEFSAYDLTLYNYWFTTNRTLAGGNLSVYPYTGARTINYTSIGYFNITFYANDSFNKVTNLTYFFNITSLPSTSFLANQSEYNVSENITSIVVGYNSSLQNVMLTNVTQVVSLDLSQLLNGGNVTIGSNNLSLTTVGITNYTLFIPAGINVSGGVGWDGKINLPTVNSSGFSVPSGSADTTIDMGSSTMELNFSNPVKITFLGKAGKSAGWSRGSLTLTNITTICNSATNPTNIDNVTYRECVISSGSDLIIWTYHLTTFGVYTHEVGTVATLSNGGSLASIAYWTSTKLVTESELVSGATKDLGTKERIKVKINNEEHYIGLVGLTSTKATINISSNTQQAEFSIGDEKKFDVNNDNFYDLSVKLNSITNNRASVSVKGLHEEISKQTTTTEDNKGIAETIKQTSEQIAEQVSENISIIWWVIIIAISLAIIAVVIIYFVKKNSTPKFHKRDTRFY